MVAIVDPLTHAQGPLGETSHDARTLLAGQARLLNLRVRLGSTRVAPDPVDHMHKNPSIQSSALFKDPGEGLQQNLAHKLVSLSQKDEESF